MQQVQAHNLPITYYNQFKSLDKDFISSRCFIPDKCLPKSIEIVRDTKDAFKNLVVNKMGVKRKINLPTELIHIEHAITQSSYILLLEDDWDGYEAMSIPNFIYNRSIEFIKDYSKSIFEKLGTVITAPFISPLNDGSIDLVWKTKHNKLLVNIKNSEKEIAYFYGVIDLGNENNDFNGKIATNTIHSYFSNWLQEFKMGS